MSSGQTILYGTTTNVGSTLVGPNALCFGRRNCYQTSYVMTGYATAKRPEKIEKLCQDKLRVRIPPALRQNVVHTRCTLVPRPPLKQMKAIVFSSTAMTVLPHRIITIRTPLERTDQGLRTQGQTSYSKTILHHP